MTDTARRTFRPLGDTGQVQGRPVVDRSVLQSQTRQVILEDTDTLNAIRDLLLAALRDREACLDPYFPAELRYQAIAEVLRPAVARDKGSNGPLQHVPTDMESIKAIYANTLGVPVVQKYLDDPLTNEVKIGGKDGCEVWVQTNGTGWRKVEERFAAKEQALGPIAFQAARKGIPLDEAHPVQTIPTDYGSRIHVTIPPRVANGLLICLRRGRTKGWRVHDYRQRGSMDDRIQRVLCRFMQGRLSFLISGATGAGKSALLESLLNEWPKGEHIITAEDRTLDLDILEHFWTQLSVDGPEMFDAMARETLRMTPHVLAPGEMRGFEAGAFVSMLLNGSALASTIHAAGIAYAPERFAIYASDPQAYHYAGKYQLALYDICEHLDLLIHVKNWHDLGLRGIAEVGFLDGLRWNDKTQRQEPNIIPLVTAKKTQAGIVWQTLVDIDEEGQVVWLDGHDRTPAKIREKLEDSSTPIAAAPIGTSLDAIQAALVDTQRYLDQHDPESALNRLQHAWEERQDAQLISMAQQALARGGSAYDPLRMEAQARRARLIALIEARHWDEAHALYVQFVADLRQAAAALPPGGWQALVDQVQMSIAEATAFERSCREIRAFLQQGEPRRALDTINQIASTGLPPAAELTLLTLREEALEQLQARGEGQNTQALLELLRIRKQVLETQG